MNPLNAPVAGQPPRPIFEAPITFVRSESEGEVHAFLPECFELDFVQEIANNFRYAKCHMLDQSPMRLTQVPAAESSSRS